MKYFTNKNYREEAASSHWPPQLYKKLLHGLEPPHIHGLDQSLHDI